MICHEKPDNSLQDDFYILDCFVSGVTESPSHRVRRFKRLKYKLTQTIKFLIKGIEVERVEFKDVRLPIQLQRAMATEAEATREAKAKVFSYF